MCDLYVMRMAYKTVQYKGESHTGLDARQGASRLIAKRGVRSGKECEI